MGYSQKEHLGSTWCLPYYAILTTVRLMIFLFYHLQHLGSTHNQPLKWPWSLAYFFFVKNIVFFRSKKTERWGAQPTKWMDDRMGTETFDDPNVQKSHGDGWNQTPSFFLAKWWVVTLKSTDFSTKSHSMDLCIYIYTYGGFLKWGYPQIIHLNGIFHYKPTVLGYPHLWKTPYIYTHTYYGITYTSVFLTLGLAEFFTIGLAASRFSQNPWLVGQQLRYRGTTL